MRTLGEPDFELDPGVIRAAIGDEEGGGRTFADLDAHPVDFGRVRADDEAARHALASGHINRLPRIKRRHAEQRERVHIGIAPSFIAAGRESGCRHAITAS